MTRKYKYDSLYYGGDPYTSYSETEAPIIEGKVFSLNPDINDSHKVTFCLDTGNDNRAVIPEYILNKIGTLIDESPVAGWDGPKKEKVPVYSLELKINELNFTEVISAIGTTHPFGLLPRSIINNWTILLDAPNKEYTITTYD